MPVPLQSDLAQNASEAVVELTPLNENFVDRDTVPDKRPTASELRATAGMSTYFSIVTRKWHARV